jgi:four helix bundle protein
MNLEPKPASKFDHEKLDVYQLELQFVGWLTALLAEASSSTASRTHEVCDQLDRASLSTLLNTAEGNGRRQRQTRAKFFDDARGSATECAACLDALVAKKIATPERIEQEKTFLLRIVSMLCGLVQRFDGAPRDSLREEAVEYRVSALAEPGIRRNRQNSRTRMRTRTSRRETVKV